MSLIYKKSDHSYLIPILCKMFYKMYLICSSLNDFADSNQNPTRGMYGSSIGGRAGGRQGGPHSSSNSNGVLPDSKPRSGSGRSGSMQPSSSFPFNKDSSQGLSQLTNRKARISKQQQQSSGLVEDLPSSGSLQSNSTRANSSEEQDYNRLLAAMDKDLDRPESPAINVSSEHSSQQSSQNKGNIYIAIYQHNNIDSFIMPGVCPRGQCKLPNAKYNLCLFTYVFQCLNQKGK